MLAILSVLLLQSFAWIADAEAFLQAKLESPSTYVDKRDIEQILFSKLSSASSMARLRAIEEDLAPMYTALPKSQQGKLAPATVRHALHRFFVQKHGWQMHGLASEGLASDALTSSDIIKDRAPAYIESLFADVLHTQGLGLRELSVFASVLTDLVHEEAAGTLHNIFDAMRLPLDGNVGRESLQMAIKMYVIEYLLGTTAVEVLTAKDGVDLDDLVPQVYPDWQGMHLHFQDLHVAYDLAQGPRRNPFVAHQHTFDDAIEFVQEFGHNLGAFQNLECHAMKSKLLEMEYQGTGRVRLSRFYADGVKGGFAFSESEEYLRHLGALDDRDQSKPSVVISNYLLSATNCLAFSGFYSVCCINECEGLMRHLEKDIAAPVAPPGRIIELVSRLSSDTVDAPRNLSSALVARINDIAEVHGGSVPLHGRLFKQWMHHAYPRECPFPLAGQVAKPMGPEEFEVAYGTVEATMDQMQSHVDSHEEVAIASLEVALESLPWLDEESLLQELPSAWSVREVLRIVAGGAVLVSVGVPLVRAASVAKAGSHGEKVERFMV